MNYQIRSNFTIKTIFLFLLCFQIFMIRKHQEVCVFLFINLSLLRPHWRRRHCIHGLSIWNTEIHPGKTWRHSGKKNFSYCFGAVSSQTSRRETPEFQVQCVSCGMLPGLHSEGFGRCLLVRCCLLSL